MSALQIALLGGFGAMLGWGIADFLAKVSIDRIGELPSLVWAHIFGTGVLAIVVASRAVVSHRSLLPGTDPGSWVGLGLFGLLQAVVYFLVYKGFGKGQVAVLSPIFASFSGVVALVSILALGEQATLSKIAACALLFVGTLLLSTETMTARTRIFATPGFKEVALATMLAACWTLGWDRLVGGRDPILFAFYMYLSMTLAFYATARHQGASLRGIPAQVWPVLVLIGCGEVVAYSALTWAYGRTTLTSVVALLSGTFSLPTIILARSFLGERFGRAQALGAVGVLGGLAVLTLR